MKRNKFTGTYGVFRVGFVALLAIGNIAVTIVIIGLLVRFAPFVEFTFSALALAIILRMTVRLRAPDHTLAWALVMMLVPILGVVLYFSWGSVSFSRNEKGYLESSMRNGQAVLNAERTHFDELKKEDQRLARQAAVLSRVGFPVYKGGGAEYFPVGERLFKHMLEDMRAAESHIFISYYIVDNGELWDSIYEVLIQKAASGLDVRVMYDDFGCVKTIARSFANELRQKGIKVAVFNPIHRYVRQLYVNYRNHQKICVIDSKVAYVGGVNIADEYINVRTRFGHWKDTGLRITGVAVRSITVEYLQMWGMVTANIDLDIQRFFPKPEDGGDYYIVPFSDGPSNNPLNPAHDIYMTMCETAYESVWYTTPYLTPDCPLREALAVAAHGGVDVRIITPGIPDHKFVYAATRGHYQQLLNAGVRIFEYTPGFMHAKMVLCDKKSAVVGSINMDTRSYYQHYENAVWLTGGSAVDDIAADFEQVFKQCKEIDKDTWARRSLPQRVFEAALCLMSPLF